MLAAELSIVEGCNDRLPGACSSDNEVGVTIVPLPLHPECLEHPLLMWIGPDVEIGKRDCRRLTERAAIVLAERLSQLVPVYLGVVGLEVL